MPQKTKPAQLLLRALIQVLPLTPNQEESRTPHYQVGQDEQWQLLRQDTNEKKWLPQQTPQLPSLHP